MLRTAFTSLWDEPRVPEPDADPWWDWAIVAVLVPATVLEGALRGGVAWPVVTTAFSLVCVVALLWRRSHPLAATVTAYGAQTVAGLGPVLAGVDITTPDTGLYATSCFLLFPYSLARWARGRDVLLGLLFVFVVHVVREPLMGSTAVDVVVGAGFLAFPAALGASVRFQRSARNRTLDQVRMQEREDLARELHDTVAHHVSGIVIQAQAGQAVAATDPAAATGVLEVIEEAATRSLTEMRAIVGLLRSGTEAERAPVPGVADLARLARDPGVHLTVELDVAGSADHLEPSVDTAVYRLVQESITNAGRHARDATRVVVQVTGDDDEVHVLVTDDGRGGGRSDDPGYGLVGMAERVELLGGSFTAGPDPDGGWSVRAVLPRPDSPTRSSP